MTINVREAAAFYGIDDADYIAKCEKAAKAVEENPEYLETYKKFADVLVGHPYAERYASRTSTDRKELFGFDLPFFTNLLVMSGYKYHENLMKEQDYEEQIVNNQKNRIKAILTSCGESGVSLVMTYWPMNFVNGEIIEVGRLQYQKKQSSIGLHIPGGCPLYIDAVKKSLDESRRVIERYFHVDRNIQHDCKSWILCPELEDLLPEKSNMREFRKLFDITPANDYNGEVIRSIYHVADTGVYTDLPENTSLQRNVKKYLLDGGNFHAGVGILNYFKNK